MPVHLTLKRKRECAIDPKKGMKEHEAVTKYGISKETVGHIREEQDELIALNSRRVEHEEIPENAATQKLDAKLLQFIRVARERKCVSTDPVLQKC